APPPAPGEPRPPADGWHRGVNRLLHGGSDRRLAADPHLRPGAVRRLGAALVPGVEGPEPLRLERLLRLPLGLLAAAGRAPAALLPLPEDLPAGRLLGFRPVSEPARHGAHRAGRLAGIRRAPPRLAVGGLLRTQR